MQVQLRAHPRYRVDHISRLNWCRCYMTGDAHHKVDLVQSIEVALCPLHAVLPYTSLKEKCFAKN